MKKPIAKALYVGVITGYFIGLFTGYTLCINEFFDVKCLPCGCKLGACEKKT